MRFSIETSSQGSDKPNKPCEKAVKETIEHNNKKKTIWTIEINSLEELLSLQEECKNPLIIEKEDFFTGLPSIEIYDDYRE